MTDSWLCQEYERLAQRVDSISTLLGRIGLNVGEQIRMRGSTWEISKYRIAQWDPDATTLPLSDADSYVQMVDGNLEIRGGQFDIHTGESGAHMEMDGEGMEAWNAGGTKTLDIDFTTGNVSITGTITATAGSIGGWNINANTIQKLTSTEGIILDSANEIIKVGDTDGTYISIDGDNKYIGLSNFVSGHRSWRIDDQGRAEFLDIIARGKIQTSIFEKETISAVNGEFLITKSSGTLDEKCVIDTDNLVVETPSDGAWVFADNDIVRIKGQASDGSYYDLWLTVTRTGTTNEYTYTRESGTTGVTFGKGVAVVAYGTSAEGGIIQTATDANAPFVDIFTNSASPWSGTTPKARLGNLAGITDPLFGALSGYGLWTENGYFSGKLKASEGELYTLDIKDVLTMETDGEINSTNNYSIREEGIYLEESAAGSSRLRFTDDADVASPSVIGEIRHFHSGTHEYTRITSEGTASYNSSYVELITKNNSDEEMDFVLDDGGELLWRDEHAGALYSQIVFRIEKDGDFTIRDTEGGKFRTDWDDTLGYYDMEYQYPDDIGIRLKTAKGDADSRGYLYFLKSRGTLSSPTAVQDGDRLGSILFGGYDSNSWEDSAAIIGMADGNWADGDLPTKLLFFVTADGSDTQTLVLSMEEDGSSVFHEPVWLLDDINLQFGHGAETIMKYDEAGDDRLEVTGANWWMNISILGLAASAYLNFGSTGGSTGYGLRDNSGTMEYKNSGGAWSGFGGGTPGAHASSHQDGGGDEVDARGLQGAFLTADIIANRPAASQAGRYFYATDEDTIYYDGGAAWQELSPTPEEHSTSHQNGGSDEISVAGLSGLLADNQNPTAHASEHQNGGVDEINVGSLSGLLADNQNPTAHASEHQNGGVDEIDARGLQGAFLTADIIANRPAAAQTGRYFYATDEDKIYFDNGASWEELTANPVGHHASHENGGSDEISVAGLSGLLADNQNPTAHSGEHQNGGVDEINVGSLSGVLANAQIPQTHALGGAKHNADTLADLNAKISDANLDDDGDSRPPIAHALGGAKHNADVLADLNAKISDATLDDTGDARTPTAHKTSHQNGGGDEINVGGLSGLLADNQNPTAHTLGGAKHNADTLADLNAKISDANLDDDGDARPAQAHDLGGAKHNADTLADLNSKVSDATLDDDGDSRPPTSHASSHETGGADELDNVNIWVIKSYLQIEDDEFIYLGNDFDVQIRYDEASNDRAEVTGAQWWWNVQQLFADDIWMQNNQLYLRSYSDSAHYIEYNSTPNGVRVGGYGGGDFVTTSGATVIEAKWNGTRWWFRNNVHVVNGLVVGVDESPSEEFEVEGDALFADDLSAHSAFTVVPTVAIDYDDGGTGSEIGLGIANRNASSYGTRFNLWDVGNSLGTDNNDGLALIQTDGDAYFCNYEAGDSIFYGNDMGSPSKLFWTNTLGHLLPGTNDWYNLGNDEYEWNAVWATDTSINSSDERDKREIQSTPLGLEFIRRLKPRRYRWKETRDTETNGTRKGIRGHHGFVGQEVKQVLDDMGVDTEDAAMYVYAPPKDYEDTIMQEDGTFETVQKHSRGGHYLRYGEFIAPLTKAVQELDKENKQLKKKVDSLEKRLDRIEKRLNKNTIGWNESWGVD